MSSASSAITTLTVAGAPHFLAAVTAFWSSFFTVVPFWSTFLAEPDTYHAVGIERGDLLTM